LFIINVAYVACPFNYCKPPRTEYLNFSNETLFENAAISSGSVLSSIEPSLKYARITHPSLPSRKQPEDKLLAVCAGKCASLPQISCCMQCSSRFVLILRAAVFTQLELPLKRVVLRL